MTKFPERLKLLREEAELSQNKLAELLKTSSASVSRWESNDHGVKADKVDAICKFFKVSPGWLLGYTDNRDDYGEEKKSVDVVGDFMDNLNKIFADSSVTEEMKQKLVLLAMESFMGQKQKK